jgi:hypothetical protein
MILWKVHDKIYYVSIMRFKQGFVSHFDFWRQGITFQSLVICPSNLSKHRKSLEWFSFLLEISIFILRYPHKENIMSYVFSYWSMDSQLKLSIYLYLQVSMKKLKNKSLKIEQYYDLQNNLAGYCRGYVKYLVMITFIWIYNLCWASA